MHIGWFGEASFGLRGQEAGKLFAGVRYATEQSTSIGCNYVRGTSEDLYIEYIFRKGGLAMRAKVGTETQCAKNVWESLKRLRNHTKITPFRRIFFFFSSLTIKE